MKVGIRELAREIALRQNCYQKDAREVLDHFVAVVTEALEQGRAVQVVGLGTFHPTARRGRTGVRFRPAAALRRRLAARQSD